MLVDWERISLLADPDDPEDQAWLTETMQNLVSDLNNRFDKLPPLFEQKAWEELKNALHQLRGVASNFGLVKLTELCTNAEDLVRASNFEQVEKLLQEIPSTWKNTQAELQKKFPST